MFSSYRSLAAADGLLPSHPLYIAVQSGNREKLEALLYVHQHREAFLLHHQALYKLALNSDNADMIVTVRALCHKIGLHFEQPAQPQRKKPTQ